jgi:hypothetical protein
MGAEILALMSSHPAKSKLQGAMGEAMTTSSLPAQRRHQEVMEEATMTPTPRGTPATHQEVMEAAVTTTLMAQATPKASPAGLETAPPAS